MGLLTPWVLIDILYLYMPGRNIPLINNQIYHIVNRGIASQPIFLKKSDYQRCIDTLLYYQNKSPSLRYSFFIRLPLQRKSDFLDQLKAEKNLLVELIAYCIMPNHIHLLVRQIDSAGISHFMSNFANSYTRYFNTKEGRIGPLFQGKFKAVRIETDDQLLHVSRYIHLNPFSSYVVKKIDDIIHYPYSSFREYISLTENNICNKNYILSKFKASSSYKKFVFDQADYQRVLQDIKHVMLEK